MARRNDKVTIEGSNLQGFGFASDWGGKNNTAETVTVHGTQVPAGKEWGVNHGEVERVIKEKVASLETKNTQQDTAINGKAGYIKIVASSDGAGSCVAVFKDSDSYTDWMSLSDADKWGEEGLALIISFDNLPSAEGSDAYTVQLTLQETPASIQSNSNVTVSVKGTSTVTYAAGGTENVSEDLIVDIQTRTNTSASWVSRGQVVVPANAASWTAVSLKPYLASGMNYVRMRAVGEYASSIWRSFSLNVVNLSLIPNSPLEFPMSEATLSLNYLVGGAVAKTLQMEFGTGIGSGFNAQYSYTNNDPGCSRSLGTSTNTSTGMTFEFTDATMLATLLSGGVHTVRARLYVSEAVSTPWVESQYIVADGSNKFVSVNNVGTTFDNWSEVHFLDWAAYCGEDEQMTVVFRLADENNENDYASWTFTAENERMYSLSVQLGIEQDNDVLTEFYGYMHIEDEEGNALASPLFMTFNNSEANQPTKGADFILQPSDRDNSEAHPDTVINAVNGQAIQSTFTGFDFVNDGYMEVLRDLQVTGLNAEKVRALHIPANRNLSWVYNPFDQFTDGNNTGRSVTLEIDFRSSNITDETEPVLRIGTTAGDGKVWGFEMLPLEAYMLTQRMRAVDDQNVSWAEDMRTRITVNVVYNLGGLNLVRIFINDKIEREFIYTTNDRFTDNGVNFVVGSTSADIDIFSIRCYKKALSTAEVMQDYKAGMVTASEKVTFTEANDILDDNGNISWSKCLGKYNIIGHTGHLPKYGDENKGKTTGVSLNINIVGDAARSGVLTALEASGQGTTAMTYYDWNQQYKITDNTVFTADDGTTTGAGTGYAIQAGEALAKKLCGKINFASGMQSHKLGLTWIFNDLFKQLVTNGVITRPGQMTEYPNARIAVLEKPFLFFHRETENDPWTFKYLMTFGAGKGDKPTFGFDKTTTPNFLMLEGANNDRPLALFRIPWNDDITYSPDDEAYMYNGQKQLNFGFGKTSKDANNKEYPSSTAAVNAHKAFFNFVYLHYSRINVFNGTLSELKRSEAVDNTKMYWVTQDEVATGSSRYDLFRYDELTMTWVDAGVEKLGAGSYEKLNLRTQYEAFCEDISVTPSSWTAGQWTVINGIIIAMRRQHFKAMASEYIHVDDALYHACFNKMHGGTDNRAKNTYYYTDPVTLKIRHEQDDLDTTIKTNNVGQNRKPYYVEEHDTNSSGDFYWQGEESGYYNLLEEAFEEEMTTMMYNMMLGMAQLGGSVMGFYEHYFFSTQDYFPGIAYNEQARLVYEAAAVAQAAGIYKNDSVQAITQSCGSQRWSEYQWMKDRIMYISSWCEYGEFAGSSTAANGMSWRGKSGATYNFQLTPAKWLYPRVGSDSGNYPASAGGRRVRVAAGDTISYPAITLSSDSWISVRGIDYYSEIGDMNIGLSSEQGTFSFSGRRLRKITVNPNGTDTNQFLATRVEISNATNIREFTMRGVTTVTGAIDLTKCTRLETVDIRGCAFSMIEFAEGAPMATVNLNDKLTRLEMSHITTLQTLTLEGVDYLSVVVLNNLGAFGRSVIEQCYSNDAPLSELVLTGMAWQSVSRELLMWLASLPSCTLTGSIRMLVSVQLTLDDILLLYDKYGDIQNEGNTLYIDYTKVVIQHIGIKGQKYFKELCTTQFGIAADTGNNIAFVGGKPALTWQFVTTDENDQEIEDSDAAEFIQLTDSVLGTARIVRLNNAGDETRYRLKVTAQLTDGTTVSNYWRIGMFDRLPKRGDFAYADGTFDDDFHYTKTVVGYAVRVTSGVDALTIDVAAKENTAIRSNNAELNTSSLPWGIQQGSDNNTIDATTCTAISTQSGVTLNSFATGGSGTGDYSSQTKTLAMTNRAKAIIRGWIANLWSSVDLTAPVFSEEETYDRGDTVTNGVTVYMCKTAVTEAEAFDLSKWSTVSAAQLALMRQAQQWSYQSKLPSNTAELGDMMLALRYLENALGATNPVRFYQLFYPAAYACQTYAPATKDGETLNEQYGRGNWMLPACGMVNKIYGFYHASRNKVSGGGISASYANEDNTLADANYPLMANILKRLTDAGANTAYYPMWTNSGFWSCSENGATGAYGVYFQNGNVYNTGNKYTSYVVRAVTAFTYALSA